MKIGLIKEIKDKENRVALTPTGVRALVRAGHLVQVQDGAGLGSGYSNPEYIENGAQIVSVEDAWASDLVMKIKEPLEKEYTYLGGQILFTYLHLAGVSKSLTEALLARNTTAVAYETVEDDHRRLPLLTPMSAVAGCMAVTMGNFHLAKINNGKGVLLGSVLGERYGNVVIIGDGVVGQHAARAADGIGANTFIAGRHPERVPTLKRKISEDLQFFLSQPDRIAAHLETADLVVGAVLLRGARAPHVVSEEMVRRMQPGSVIVDVSIDQGGAVETSHPTSHSKPVFEKHGVIHYCVTNMPGAYPRTSTIALTRATLPYVISLANEGIQALHKDMGFAKGVNTYRGYVTCKPVAEALALMPKFKKFL